NKNKNKIQFLPFQSKENSIQSPHSQQPNAKASFHSNQQHSNSPAHPAAFSHTPHSPQMLHCAKPSLLLSLEFQSLLQQQSISPPLLHVLQMLPYAEQLILDHPVH